MTNDKPNLTDSHFAEVLAEPFAELLKPKKFYPTIMVEYTPNKEEWEEIVGAIWVGALEGGSNHWIDSIHTYGNNLKSSYDVVEFNFDIAIHHGSDGWGDDVVNGINVEEVEVEKVKAFDVIVDGINLLDPERQRMALTVSELGQLDANDYDYIIQLGVFGKEVYC
tara:strand:- start:970 stop:1467 length:498 start_codon:yes stop_codon:yes gene_type:complete